MSEEQFSTAFQKYGVPWRGEQGSELAKIIESLLQVFRWAVGAQERNIGARGRTYCDVLENSSFNALATHYQGYDLVTLFAGTINFIFSVYFTFLSDAKTLPALGDISGHFVPPSALDAIRARRVIYTTDHVPKNKQRFDAAHSLSFLSCLFILMHEVGHIVWGHSMFLKRRFDLDVYEEIAHTSMSQEQSAVRMAFEWEADDYAADASYQLLRHMLDAGMFPELKDLHPDVIWSISTSMVFLLIAHHGGGNLDRKSATHPRPIHRCTWSMLTVTQAKRCAPFLPDGERFRNGFEEARSWFQRNDLGLYVESTWDLQLTDLETEYKKAKAVLRDEGSLLQEIQSERAQAKQRWFESKRGTDSC